MGKTGVDDQAFAADNYNCKRIGFIEHTAKSCGKTTKVSDQTFASDKLQTTSCCLGQITFGGFTEKVVTTA